MTTQQMLDDRYGRGTSRRRRVLWWTAVGLVAALAIGWLGWTTIARTIDAVDATDTGFVVADERTVSITFQLTVPLGRDVACVIEAQDEEHGIVGWRVVEYPGADAHTRAFSEQIPTVALATTGLVNSCWVT